VSSGTLPELSVLTCLKRAAECRKANQKEQLFSSFSTLLSSAKKMYSSEMKSSAMKRRRTRCKNVVWTFEEAEQHKALGTSEEPELRRRGLNVLRGFDGRMEAKLLRDTLLIRGRA
jgi:hypothetical protein